MANFRYGTGPASNRTWTDVPNYAVHGTYEGTVQLVYPESSDFDGLGRPCAAIGKAAVHITSGMMTASGMMFWQSFFTAASSTSASICLKIFDPRAANAGASAWTTCSGYLTRPRWQRVKVGTDAATQGLTWYYNVEITVNNCDTTGVV